MKWGAHDHMGQSYYNKMGQSYYNKIRDCTGNVGKRLVSSKEGNLRETKKFSKKKLFKIYTT